MMIDREKVIKGLECCAEDCVDGCPYEDLDVEGWNCTTLLCRDALELLKEREHPDFSGSLLTRDDYVRIGDVMDCLSEVFVPKDDLIHIEGLIEWAMGKRAISKEELLKAQEPRLLTLDEILQLPNDTPIYNENRNGPSGWDVFTRLAKDGTNDIVTGAVYWGEYSYWEQNAYGKTWRCWTSRPTDEQREATSWND